MNHSGEKPKIVCITGPTACGKTAVSVELAKLSGGEIVSCDSVQVYREMDIGSAKPTAEEMRGIPHHMIGVYGIDEKNLSVARYREDAMAAIRDISERKRLPIVVGGSGLYLNALLYGLNFAVPAEETVRRALEEEFPPESGDKAHEALRAVDAVTAERLHPNDRKRILRALEVFRCSGKPMSEFGNSFFDGDRDGGCCDSLVFGLRMEREVLYERINRRVDEMLSAGLEQEVRGLVAKGYGSYPAMNSIGYRQFIPYFEGECTYEEAVERIKMESRRYAKRQIAWFKRDASIVVTDVDGRTARETAENIWNVIREKGYYPCK